MKKSATGNIGYRSASNSTLCFTAKTSALTAKTSALTAAKIAALGIFVIMLAAALMPTSAFASTTWGEGSTDEEKLSDVIVNFEGSNHKEPSKINWIKYKKGYFKDHFSFVNKDEEIGVDPDPRKGVQADHKTAIAKYELKRWAKLAHKIFKSGATTGGKTTAERKYGATSYTLLHDWDYYFEHNSRAHGEINLADWLQKMSPDKDNYSAWPASWDWYTTGIKRADTLADVRKDMVSSIGGHHGISSDMVYKQRSTQDNPNGVLSAMNNNKAKGDGVYYTIVTHFTDESLMGETSYNCYAIVLYDLNKTSLYGDGLYYPFDKSSEVYQQSEVSDETVIPMQNPDEVRGEGKIEYTEGYQHSDTFTHATNWQVSGGGHIDLGFEIGTGSKIPVNFQFKPEIGFHLEGGWQDTQTNGEENIDSHTKTVQLTSPLMAHTGKNYTNSKTEEKDSGDYDDPVGLNYGIAICSISGKHIHGYNSITTGSDFCTFFEGGSSDAGQDAITNLYVRRNADSVNESYGKTEGYVNSKSCMTELAWDSDPLKNEYVDTGSKTEKITDILDRLQSEISMVSQGMNLGVMEANYILANGESTALYPLTSVKLASNDADTRIIDISEGDEYLISGLKVKGYDSGGPHNVPVEFFGFDPNAGYWDVATKDKDGNDLPKNKIVIVTDPNSGVQTLKVNELLGEGQKAYICWHINNGKKYITLDGKYVDDTTLKDRAYVEVRTHGPYDNYKVEFQDTEKPATGCALEEIHLNTVLPVNVKNAEDKVVSNAVKYELAGPSISDEEAQIIDGTILKVKRDVAEDEDRVYEIKASYGDNVQTVTTTKNAKVKVLPGRKLTLHTGGEQQIVKPGMEKHKQGVNFELSNYYEEFDQYDEPWKGDTPVYDYAVTGGDVSYAEITELGFLAVSRPGSYKVAVFEKGGSAKNPLGTLTFDVIENPNQAKTPKGIPNLIYDGSEQTGVRKGEGYTLTGERATDAGTHYATATLREGYDWADGHRFKKRKVRYRIDYLRVDKPRAATGLVYNGKAQSGVPAGEGYKLTGAPTGIGAGNYEAFATPEKNYLWSDGTSQEICLGYKIAKAKVAVPGKAPALTYNGKAQTAVPAANGYSVTGGAATNAGTYTATAVLKDKKNNEWTSGGTADLKISYTIAKSKVKAPGKAPALTYNGKAQTAVPAANGYSVTGGAATNAGTYTATAVLKDKKNNEWTSGGTADLKISYTIAKISNTITVKGKTAKVKYKKIKKKTQKISRSKVMTIKKAKGKLSYKKVKGNKKITIDKKNGKVTVKKKLKKGTYKIKAKVKAAGTTNYKARTKTVTFKIIVK